MTEKRMRAIHTEERFEETVEAALLASGWLKGVPGFFRPDRGLDTGELFTSIGATQNEAWDEVIKRHGGDAGVAQTKFLDPARVNISEADLFGNHCVVAVSSFGSLIHTAVGSAGGSGGLRTKRSGCWA